MSELPILSIITFLPLATAILILLLPGLNRKNIQALAIGGSGLSGLLSAWLFYDYQSHADSSFQYVEHLSWLPDMGIAYKLGVDGLSVPMMFLTGIICLTASIMSLSVRSREKEYFVLALTAMSGVYGVFASLDLFFLILFYELASIPMFFLVGIWGSDKAGGGRAVTRQQAATKLLIYLQLGGGLVLLGIFGLYFGSGLNTFDFTELQKATMSAGWQKWLFLILFIGFGIEAGLFPFHTWLPDGHSCAPTALSMLLAGVLLKMGGYGIMRLGIQLLPEGAAHWMGFFMVVAVVNVIYGGFCALRQTDIKVMIAYSSVSHMGMVFLGLACVNAATVEAKMFGLSGAMFQMYSHGVITALLFALAGTVYEITHARDLMKWGGLASRMPFFASFYVLGAMASLGLPGMTGFAAELMVFIGFWQTSPYLCLFAILGLVITTTYLLRSVQYGFYGPLNPKHAEVRDANSAEKIALVILALSTLIFGILPSLMVDPMSATIEVISKGYL